MRFNYKYTLIIAFTALLITINFVSTAYELENPGICNICNVLQKRQDNGNGGGGPKKVIDPSSTCTTSDDARCKSPPGVPPKVETYMEVGIKTVTPTPIPGENDNNKITSFITTTTTLTIYFAGYITTITTKNSRGELTTIATSVLPSTLLVVKTVAITPPTASTIEKADISDSTTNLQEFSSHSLWGATMSLALIITTLIFMVFV